MLQIQIFISMVRKLIISIIFLVLCISVEAQGNFFFNQHECQYGDLTNYVNITVYYYYHNQNNDYENFFSVLSEVKQCLDSLRNNIGGIGGMSNYAAFYGYDINNYALQIESGSAICALKTTEDKYYIIHDDNLFTVGGARIIKFTNGIITSSESY